MYVVCRTYVNLRKLTILWAAKLICASCTCGWPMRGALMWFFPVELKITFISSVTVKKINASFRATLEYIQVTLERKYFMLQMSGSHPCHYSIWLALPLKQVMATFKNDLKDSSFILLWYSSERKFFFLLIKRMLSV